MVIWMTEKRFKVNADYLNNIDSIIDNETGIEHDYLEIEELLNELAEENKELQERNDRQYKQLGDLYRLIEEKDWRALTDIMDDFKKADEQLQKEWKCYE